MGTPFYEPLNCKTMATKFVRKAGRCVDCRFVVVLAYRPTVQRLCKNGGVHIIHLSPHINIIELTSCLLGFVECFSEPPTRSDFSSGLLSDEWVAGAQDLGPRLRDLGVTVSSCF